MVRTIKIPGLKKNTVFLFLTNGFQVCRWNVDRKIQTSSFWETSARIPNDLNRSIEQQTTVFFYSRISDPSIRKSFQTFFLYVCKVFKSDFDRRNRFCSNKAYQLKCRVEMVYLAPSRFLGRSWIRNKNQIETISKPIPQYKIKASVLDLVGKLKFEVAYRNGFVYQNKSKVKIFEEFLNYQKSDGNSRPGKFWQIQTLQIQFFRLRHWSKGQNM